MTEDQVTQKELAIAYQTVFNGSAMAMRVYDDLMKVGYNNRMTDAFDASGSIDPVATAINSGKRFMALRINNFKAMDPNKEVQKEAD